jgi:hypothetical protein
MNELALVAANFLAGTIGYGFIQLLKWLLFEYKGVVLEGRLAANITLGMSLVLGIASVAIAFSTLGIPYPTEWQGWASLVGQSMLAIMGAATVIYKNVQFKPAVR